MADNTVEPGAPSAKAASDAAEKVTPTNISKPNSSVSALKQMDSTILRLNKYYGPHIHF
jgi:hypothetical protein